jgi:hypothetical protein
MIYLLPTPDDPIDQGDVVDGCPGFRSVMLVATATFDFPGNSVIIGVLKSNGKPPHSKGP